MFTGIVTDTGVIASIKRRSRGVSFCISSNYDCCDLELGESIACNGACLTVTRILDGQFEVDATSETLSRTTLGRLVSGSRLHLERALRVGDRLGGHYVTGHIDVVGELMSVDGVGNDGSVGTGVNLIFEAPVSFASSLVEKGSIAINGVSLTVNRVEDLSSSVRFGVTVIPFTYAETCFSSYRPGEKVNLEGDLFGKYVNRFLSLERCASSSHSMGSVTWEMLRNHGF